jgi:hypothetical protein
MTYLPSTFYHKLPIEIQIKILQAYTNLIIEDANKLKDCITINKNKSTNIWMKDVMNTLISVYKHLVVSKKHSYIPITKCITDEQDMHMEHFKDAIIELFTSNSRNPLSMLYKLRDGFNEAFVTYCKNQNEHIVIRLTTINELEQIICDVRMIYDGIPEEEPIMLQNKIFCDSLWFDKETSESYKKISEMTKIYNLYKLLYIEIPKHIDSLDTFYICKVDVSCRPPDISHKHHELGLSFNQVQYMEWEERNMDIINEFYSTNHYSSDYAKLMYEDEDDSLWINKIY